MDLSVLLSGDALVSLVTLTAMEIVLGIDNVVFIAILVGKLPAAQQALARRLGLTLALVDPDRAAPHDLLDHGSHRAALYRADTRVSGRDLILIGGGLFLIVKATWEIYDKVEGDHAAPTAGKGRAQFIWVLAQILVLDIVFSLDSVITAVGMANHISIMVIAMVLAMLVMLVSAAPIGGFVERHPSVKILALAFLLLIGVMLVAEGMGTHVDKGYIYVAMAFSLFVEMLNLHYRKKQKA